MEFSLLRLRFFNSFTVFWDVPQAENACLCAKACWQQLREGHENGEKFKQVGTTTIVQHLVNHDPKLPHFSPARQL